MSNNNDQDEPMADQQPPEEEANAANNNNANVGDAPLAAGQQGGGGGGGVRVSSDDAANSSEYPESITEQEEGSSDSTGSKAENGKEGADGVEGIAESSAGGSSSGNAPDDPKNRENNAPPKKPTAPKKKKKRTSSESGDPSEHSIAAREPTFPVKLHRILSSPEHEEAVVESLYITEIISWLPHGRSWRIHQQKRFEEEVLPLYFRHGRYSSLCRQVNGWGFRRVLQGSDYNSYYHELFLRNVPHLCERMRRMTPKDIASRRNDNHYAVPDFYSLSQEHPLPGAPSDTAEIDVAPTYAAAVQAGPHSTVADYTTSATTSIVASSVPSSSIPQNIPATSQGGTGHQLMIQTELQMLEKRRKEIVDRISLLAANLGQSTASASTGSSTAPGSLSVPQSSAGAQAGPSVPGLKPVQSLLTGQSTGGGPVAVTAVQPGMIALLQNPGGAQMLAQLLQGIQDNSGRTSRQPTMNTPMLFPSPPPPPPPAPAAADSPNPFLSIPGGMQMIQQLLSAANNSFSSAPAAPVAPAPMAASSQMGEAQVLVERLMQIFANPQPSNNATTTTMTQPLLTARAPVLSTTFAAPIMQPTQPQSAAAVSTSQRPTAPPPTGIPDAILQMIAAAQATTTPSAPSVPISNMPQQPINNNYAGGQQQQQQQQQVAPTPTASAILQMLSTAMAPAVAAAQTQQQPQPQQTTSAPAVATVAAAPFVVQPAAPVGPAQQPQQHVMQLLQNGNIASLLSSMSSQPQQDKSQGK